MQPAIQPTLYESLEALPEGVTGEILNGQLHTQPRPAGPHAVSGSVLGADLLGPFQKGVGGPGGWWIIDEPELHFERDLEVLVPDLAGWRRERMPYVPEDQRFEVVPDWVCEILSPSTKRKDRIDQAAAVRTLRGAVRLADRSGRAHAGGLPTRGRRLDRERPFYRCRSGGCSAVRGGKPRSRSRLGTSAARTRKMVTVSVLRT